MVVDSVVEGKDCMSTEVLILKATYMYGMMDKYKVTCVFFNALLYR